VLQQPQQQGGEGCEQRVADQQTQNAHGGGEQQQQQQQEEEKQEEQQQDEQAAVGTIDMAAETAVETVTRALGGLSVEQEPMHEAGEAASTATPTAAGGEEAEATAGGSLVMRAGDAASQSTELLRMHVFSNRQWIAKSLTMLAGGADQAPGVRVCLPAMADTTGEPPDGDKHSTCLCHPDVAPLP
jgi:hypothetical protein